MEKYRIIRIGSNADFARLVRQVEAATWDTDNEVDAGDYTAESLANFVTDPDCVFVVAYHDQRLVGMASAVRLVKPYEKFRWLYIDEVDVVADFRRQGVGRAMMDELLRIAKAEGCAEAWLGTEEDNEPAKNLYRSVQRVQTESFVGFTYPLD